MNLYQSGVPRNDIMQYAENTLCTHRLFSLHSTYEANTIRWVDNVRYCPDYDSFLKRNPHIPRNANRIDIARQARQARLNDEREFKLVEIGCSAIQEQGKYPRNIMLDSGAFTAWQRGHVTDVDTVSGSYERFLEVSKGLFDSIVAVNLDVIPGEKGRDPTQQELKDAVIQSDKNFDILQRRFGDIILPVYHQGEPESRLEEVIGQARYICISPRNDVAETHRVTWSRETHDAIDGRVKTHGLATTGNEMIRTVPWTSGDSAAFVLHGAMGMTDVFFEDGEIDSLAAHYKGFFTALDQINIDEEYGERVLGMSNLSNYYDNVSSGIQRRIRETGENIGFPFVSLQWDNRARNLVCMWSLEQMSKRKAPAIQSSLF